MSSPRCGSWRAGSAARGRGRSAAMPWRRSDLRLALGAAVILLGAAGAVGGWQWRENHRATQQAMRLTGGDPARGQGLMRHYGCAGCHEIPGVHGADGRVGPSLDHVAGRLYIAGVLPNTALAEFDDFPRNFNELRKFSTLPTSLMASTETVFLPKQC